MDQAMKVFCKKEQQKDLAEVLKKTGTFSLVILKDFQNVSKKYIFNHRFSITIT